MSHYWQSLVDAVSFVTLTLCLMGSAATSAPSPLDLPPPTEGAWYEQYSGWTVDLCRCQKGTTCDVDSKVDTFKHADGCSSKGGFGEVLCLTNKKTHEKRCLKIIPKDSHRDASQVAHFKRVFEEIRVTHFMRQERVKLHALERNLYHSPTLFEWFLVGGAPTWTTDGEGARTWHEPAREEECPIKVVLVTNWCAGGDLYNDLAANVVQWGAEERYNVARRVLKTLCKELVYLHGFGIVHRDIKAENILLLNAPAPRSTSREDTVFLCADYGLARQLGLPDPYASFKRAVGTAGWVPPEVVRASRPGRVSVTNRFTCASDVWGAGRVASFLLDFDSRKDAFTTDNTARRAAGLRHLIQQMMSDDPAVRPTAAEALDHVESPQPAPLAGTPQSLVRTLWKEGKAPQDGPEGVTISAGGGARPTTASAAPPPPRLPAAAGALSEDDDAINRKHVDAASKYITKVQEHRKTSGGGDATDTLLAQHE